MNRYFQFVYQVPLLGRWLRYWRVNRRFKVERQVLKGKHRSQGQAQSILFFTVFKAASSFIGEVLNKITAGSGLTPVDLDGYFFDRGQGREWEGGGRKLYPVQYNSQGYFYGPFRSFNRQIPGLDQYKIILVLRDPRDVLVSGYYSLYSHAIASTAGKKEIRAIQERRRHRLTQTIDEYVIDKVANGPQFMARYYEYHRELMGKPNVLFLKYEEMVTDFASWLEKLLDFLDSRLSDELLNEIKALANFNVVKEDKFRHKRQVTPGDHERKLKKETVEQLNGMLKELLDMFEYI